jgi:hypothetical protein
VFLAAADQLIELVAAKALASEGALPHEEEHMHCFVFAASNNNPKIWPDDADKEFIPCANSFMQLHNVPKQNVLKFKNLDKGQVGDAPVRQEIQDGMDATLGDLDTFVYLGHGDKNPAGLISAGFYGDNIPALAQRMWKNSNHKAITIVLYACWAGVQAGFGARLVQQLSNMHKLKVKLFGHFAGGVASRLPSVNLFDVGPGISSMPHGEDFPFSTVTEKGKWAKWKEELKKPASTLWMRYPFMSPGEIATELGV